MSYYSSSEGALYGVEGLGQVARRVGSAMDAIIKTSRDVSGRFAALQGSPAQARAAAPGTNEARGVAQTFADAAKRAAAAKRNEATAKALAVQGDKRGAAQKAIVALQQARDAITLANKAEKTRLTRALDVMAKQLDSQAEYLRNMAEMENSSRGPTLQSMKKLATSKQLASEAKGLRKKSATVAALPAAPPKAPTDAKVAELASKYNIRTASEMSADERRAGASVLSDLAAAPLAQVRDYEGAWQYYGADGLGRLMADLEFNSSTMPAALQGAIHGIADASSIAIMADANAAFERARALSRGAMVRESIPAEMSLGNLGALGGEWEDWCAAKVPGRLTDAARAYDGDVQKCQTWIPTQPPWTDAGIVLRGGNLSLKQVIDAAKVAVTETGKVVATSPAATSTQKTPAQLAAETAARQAQQDAIARGPSLADQYKSTVVTVQAATAKMPAYVWALGGIGLLGGGLLLYKRFAGGGSRYPRYAY